jgi:hypothetical protein
MAYMATNNVAGFLAAQRRRLVLHVPIVGGGDFADTIVGFDLIAKSFATDARLVVWLNEAANGEIERDGKDFEQMAVYVQHKAKILAVVRVPQHNSELFGRDMQTILKSKMTFAEAIESPATRLMSRQRLTMMQREIFEQLALFI